MKLFIVALSGLEHPVMPQFARDALRCAKLFSGMEVVALTDHSEKGWDDANPYMERAKKFRADFRAACGNEPRELPAILRWFVIEEYVRAHSISPPIMQIDWEIMVFDNIEAHCRKLSVTGGDFGDMVDREMTEHNRTNPYWINNLGAIGFFTSLLEAHAKNRTPLFVGHKCGGDMNWWEHARNEGCYTPVDISVERDGAIFDANVYLEKHIYRSSNESKLIFWKEGKPYFIRQDTGAWVKAVAIHCFWAWKQKTSPMLQKAISNFSDECIP